LELIKKHNPAAPVFFSRHEPSFIEDLKGDRHPVDWLKGKNVYGFSGIAGPALFLDIIRGTGADIVGTRPFRDHYGFTRGDVDAVVRTARRAGAEWIITTEKDIMRLGDFELPHNLLVLGIEFSVDRGLKDFLFKTDSSLEA
jgi:tetraacyldisaccharide 4'-kinase